jgi:hypothetical protein
MHCLSGAMNYGEYYTLPSNFDTGLEGSDHSELQNTEASKFSYLSARLHVRQALLGL